MGHRKIIETHYTDICNLADLLTKLVNSYRLLVGGANELNGIALAKRSDVKDALKRVDEVGELIDDVIDALEVCEYSYLQYCKLKSEFIKTNFQAKYIQTEIDEELKLNEASK